MLLCFLLAAICELPLHAFPSSIDPVTAAAPVPPPVPTLTIGTITGVVASPISIPIHATDIVNMGSFQFSIEFDNTLMTYDSASNWYQGISDVLGAEISPGKLAFIWAGETDGINIPDSTFFNLNFQWLGSSLTSPLIWSDDPTPREFGDYNGVIFYPAYTHGSVTGFTPPPEQLDLTDTIVGDGQTACFSATQTINVAGNETFFTVLTGGSVTLIAGEVIHFQPGTSVDSGGYLDGHITTTGSYCGVKEPAMTGNLLIAVEKSADIPLPEAWFKVYPNPTNGRFILEILSEKEFQQSVIRIYGPMGEPVTTDEVSSGTTKELSLEGKPAGLYFISVRQKDKSATTKILLR
jgi:hypothetical protein